VLPTYAEWLHALKNGGTQPKKSAASTTAAKDEVPEMHAMMNRADPNQQVSNDTSPETSGQTLLPDLNFKPNQYGIRGLNQSVGEWSIRFLGPNSKTETREAEYVILGGIENRMDKNVSNTLFKIRHPWEAFEKVGFRCARSVSMESRKAE
jgi:formylglycine-generating enzyme required for sulfatase activity